MTNTGWTWHYVLNHCDLPTYQALSAWWEAVPPVPMQLRRIAQYLGLPSDTPASASRATPPASSPEDAMQAAAMAGLPVMQGRPADPLLDLIPPAPPPT